MEPLVQTQRIAYLDLVKSAATFAVVLTHVTAQLFNLYSVGSSDWVIVDVLDSLTRWAVPAFLMVNGALMLDGSRSLSMRELWMRRIARLVLAYACWSTLYACYHVVVDGWSGWVAFAGNIIRGEYHLWFLPMFIVVTALMPILRLIARNERVLDYACLIFAASLFISYVPLFEDMALGSAISSLVGDAHVPLAYAGYCLLGYRLSTADFSPRRRCFVYAVGLLGLAGTAIGTWLLSVRAGSLSHIYDNLLPNVFVTAVALFVASRQCCPEGGVLAHRLETVSAASFGAYLLHPLLIDLFMNVMLETTFIVGSWLALVWASAISFASIVIVSLIRGLIARLRQSRDNSINR